CEADGGQLFQPQAFAAPLDGGPAVDIGPSAGFAYAQDESALYWFAAPPTVGIGNLMRAEKSHLDAPPTVLKSGVLAFPLAAGGDEIYYFALGPSLNPVFHRASNRGDPDAPFGPRFAPPAALFLRAPGKVYAV